MSSSPDPDSSHRVYAAFATPFGEAHLPDAAPLNAALKRVILDLERPQADFRNPDPVVQQPEALFESRFEFFANSDPAVRALKQFCWEALGKFFRQLATPEAEIHAAADLRVHSQTWFHITRSGGYFGYHNHPMASWSGVYCVTDGEPDAERSNNGVLVFPHPLPSANSFLDCTNGALQWPFSNVNLVLKLVPGQLVLFPSWLGHYVTPFYGKGERITVAFNAWFKLGDG